MVVVDATPRRMTTTAVKQFVCRRVLSPRIDGIEQNHIVQRKADDPHRNATGLRRRAWLQRQNRCEPLCSDFIRISIILIGRIIPPDRKVAGVMQGQIVRVDFAGGLRYGHIERRIGP